MPEPRLRALIKQSIKMDLIDLHSLDQDGSHVIMVGDVVRYLTRDEATTFLDGLIRSSGDPGEGPAS